MNSPRTTEVSQTDSPLWIWLFPAAYALHIAEEYWGGEGFPAWISRLAPSPMSDEFFLLANAIGLAAMIFCTALAASGTGRWLPASIAAVELSNGIFHAAASLVTATYSPGLATGLLLWVPLGTWGLARLRKQVGSGFWPSAAGGLLFQIALSWTLLTQEW